MAGRVGEFAIAFSVRLGLLLDDVSGVPQTLREAVRYALLSTGKRLRPFLVDRCAVLVGGQPADAFAPGAALEMVHAFSLVHDDLPAMDDDDLRRGQPTCHKVYGEAVAILAGDALLALAFETLAKGVSEPRRAAALTAVLARGTGWMGMIGGQVDDLAGEHQPMTLSLVRTIHDRKTAALFVAACRMGGIAGGASEAQLVQLEEYGRHLGLAFQIADDLLDVTATPEEIGKNVAKDAARRKQTYPGCVGTKQAVLAGVTEVNTAIAALADFGPEADELRALARYVMARWT
ncbi:MAG: polyprenyl synthetase family protein [Phycisphaerales bacterium]|nr:polyprenyl synthetase family protein [Phycisphaerales bacterium]